MRRRAGRRGLVAGLLAGVLTLLAACSSGDDAAPPPAFDPPVAFAAPSGTLFGGPASRVFGRDAEDLPVGLEGTTVWTTDAGSLNRVDSTGAVVTLPLPPGRHAAGAPRAVGSVVLAGSATVIPGSGTRPPGLAAELLAVDRTADPSASAPTWTAAAPLPWVARTPSVRLRVAGASDGVAVLTVSTSDQRTTVGVDLAARRVLWTADGVAATGIVRGPGGPVAVGVATPPGANAGYAPSSAVGLDLLRGTTRFSALAGTTATTVAVAGPALLAVTGRDGSTARAFLRFLGADGAEVRAADLGTATSAPRCTWDERTVTVCAGAASVSGVDATTAAPLWSLPAPGRVAPAITTAWHGAVYGTTVNGPVVLDGRTGADRNPTPGAAPLFVGPYLGVALGAGALGGVVIVPAVR